MHVITRELKLMADWKSKCHKLASWNRQGLFIVDISYAALQDFKCLFPIKTENLRESLCCQEEKNHNQKGTFKFLILGLFFFKHRSLSSTQTVESHPCWGSFQMIPGCCGEGLQGEAASSCPYGKHGGAHVWLKWHRWETSAFITNAGNDSIKKKATNTFISTITRTDGSLQSHTKKKKKEKNYLHQAWKEKEGSKHLWAGDGNKTHY